MRHATYTLLSSAIGRKFSTLCQAQCPRRNAESPTLPLPDTDRTRHQAECSWNPTQSDWGVTVTGVSSTGDEAVESRSHSGVPGRSVGGANAAVPIIYPDTGTTHPTMSPEHPIRFSPACH